MLRILLAIAVVVFAGSASRARAQLCAPFTDVAVASPFCTHIQWMFSRGITFGCTATAFCPENSVRRDQMAAFMYRFADVAFQQGGNAFGTTGVLGSINAQPLDVRVNNARVMRYEPNAISPNVIGGNPANHVVAGVHGATIGGGAASPTDPTFSVVGPNRVTDVYGTVRGGVSNNAGSGAVWNYAGDGDGPVNAASFATVGGGWNNMAIGFGSTVAGGYGHRAIGHSSMVAGGYFNYALGAFSFAAGARTVAEHDGCFVFGLAGYDDAVGCQGPYVASFVLGNGLSIDYFSPNASGGGTRWVRFGHGNTDTIATWTGARLNAGVWVNASDRALKEGFTAVDSQAILDEVVRLPIMRWHYRHDGPSVTHIGPTAQDFKAAFGLGQSDTGIGTVDADGVALVAIQGLKARLDAKFAVQARQIDGQARELAAHREEIAAHSEELAALKRAMDVLVTRVRRQDK